MIPFEPFLTPILLLLFFNLFISFNSCYSLFKHNYYQIQLYLHPSYPKSILINNIIDQNVNLELFWQLFQILSHFSPTQSFPVINSSSRHKYHNILATTSYPPTPRKHPQISILPNFFPKNSPQTRQTFLPGCFSKHGSYA